MKKSEKNQPTAAGDAEPGGEGLFFFRLRRLLVLLPVKRFLVFETNLPTAFLLFPVVEVMRFSSSSEELIQRWAPYNQ